MTACFLLCVKTSWNFYLCHRFMQGQSSNVPIFREPLSQCPTPRPIYLDHQQRVPDSEGLMTSGGVTQGFPGGEGRTEPQETHFDTHTPQGASYTPQETPETSTAATFSRNHRDTQRPQVGDSFFTECKSTYIYSRKQPLRDPNNSFAQCIYSLISMQSFLLIKSIILKNTAVTVFYTY